MDTPLWLLWILEGSWISEYYLTELPLNIWVIPWCRTKFGSLVLAAIKKQQQFKNYLQFFNSVKFCQNIRFQSCLKTFKYIKVGIPMVEMVETGPWMQLTLSLYSHLIASPHLYASLSHKTSKLTRRKEKKWRGGQKISITNSIFNIKNYFEWKKSQPHTKNILSPLKNKK